MIPDQLSAAWACVQAKDFAAYCDDTDLRIVICGIWDFLCYPTHLPNYLRRAVQLTVAHEVAAPGVLLIEPAVVEQPPAFVYVNLLSENQVFLYASAEPDCTELRTFDQAPGEIAAKVFRCGLKFSLLIYYRSTLDNII